MPITSVFIPQIGEGLQEARVVAFLKQPGDKIQRDEPIYQMETDKAVMDVESPVDGVLVAWSAKPDDVLAIGAEIATVNTDQAITTPSSHTPPPNVPTQNQVESSALSNTPSTGTELRIPQIGEGLQEARIVAFLKNPGDFVKRDEPIYQMETDKAVMDVESPYQGTLVNWMASVDQVVPIDSVIAIMQTEGAVVSAPASHGQAAPAAVPIAAPSTPSAAGSDMRGIPPRTRAYAKEKGVSDDQLASISFSTARMLPSDIDAFLASGATPVAAAKSASAYAHSDAPVNGKQRVLNSRMVRSNALVVPGTITVVTKWAAIEQERANLKAAGGTFQPSTFTMFAFAVVQSLKEFPSFRTVMVGDDTLRTFKNVSLGIAVGLPGDELVIAVVDNSDTMSWPEFAQKTREQIELARTGKDQAHEAVTVSLTNMQAAGLRQAVPVVVAPSVATIFLGEVHNGLDPDAPEPKVQRQINLTMTFDHRVINGMGASHFLNDVKRRVEKIQAELSK